MEGVGALMETASAKPLKIFVTVGAQMPFDRLVLGVDRWASGADGCRVFAQIGPDAQKPAHIEWTEFLEPPQFRERVLGSDVLVAHAGMGSILTALQYGKPVLVMPRRGSLRETRNDHQVATAERFKALGKVAVAMDESELAGELDRLRGLRSVDRISEFASDDLIRALRDFIHSA